MLYELHYNTHPFRGHTKKEIAKKIQNDELEFPPSWQKGREGDYKFFKKLLKRLLIKEPEVGYH